MKKSLDEIEYKIPEYKKTLNINGTEGILNVTGDYHTGASFITGDKVVKALGETVDKYGRENIFRIITGDIYENALKTSVGHNYDVTEPDPDKQRIDITNGLTESNKKLHGLTKWKKMNASRDPQCVAVEGNHELRSRKLTGDWPIKQISKDAKIKYLGMQGIVRLKIVNKRLKMSKIYNIYVAHRLSKSNATTLATISRSFQKKQSSLPGIDIITCGHYHKRLIIPNGYYSTTEKRYKKTLWVVNPSPLGKMEYVEEEGYPPNLRGYQVNIHLPLDKEPYGIV